MEYRTPEYLDWYAERISTAGFPTDAVNIRAIASEWRREQRALADAQAENTLLQRRLDACSKAVRETVAALADQHPRREVRT
jgi:hypothetical protein